MRDLENGIRSRITIELSLHRHLHIIHLLKWYEFHVIVSCAVLCVCSCSSQNKHPIMIAWDEIMLQKSSLPPKAQKFDSISTPHTCLPSCHPAHTRSFNPQSPVQCSNKNNINIKTSPRSPTQPLPHQPSPAPPRGAAPAAPKSNPSDQPETPPRSAPPPPPAPQEAPPSEHSQTAPRPSYNSPARPAAPRARPPRPSAGARRRRW